MTLSASTTTIIEESLNALLPSEGMELINAGEPFKLAAGNYFFLKAEAQAFCLM